MSSPTSVELDHPHASIWTDLIRTSFQHAWVNVNDIPTRYLRAGDPGKPTVVLLAGTSGHLETFSRNIGALSQDFDCLAFDMVGAGFSGKPDHDYEISDYVAHTAAILDVLGIDHASIIGVSLGAWIAAAFAAEFPERVARLVLLSPAGLLSSPSAQNSALVSRTKVAQDPSWDNVTATLSKLVHDPRCLTDDIVAVRQLAYREPDAQAAMAHILVLQRSDARQRNNLTEAQWRSIDAPALIVASVDDPNTWLDTAYALGGLMPHSMVIEMRGVAHWPHYEKPEEFNSVVTKFLLET